MSSAVCFNCFNLAWSKILWSGNRLTGFQDSQYFCVITVKADKVHWQKLNSFPNIKFWTLPNSEFADDNFNFTESGGKFSKQVENTVGKGEIARYEQFLLFLQCFPKTGTADM